MSEVKDHAKAELLKAMYRSVARMNRHILEGNFNSATSEEYLQKNLRKNFEELEKED